MIRVLGGWRWLVVGFLLAWLLVLLIFTTTRSQGGEGRERKERNWMGFTSREARLAGRVREGEARIQWLTLQLENSHKKLARVGGLDRLNLLSPYSVCVSGCSQELRV